MPLVVHVLRKTSEIEKAEELQRRLIANNDLISVMRAMVGWYGHHSGLGLIDFPEFYCKPHHDLRSACGETRHPEMMSDRVLS